ncbi:NUDIX domain-containing protein [Streptomyces sp. NPDC001739]
MRGVPGYAHRREATTGRAPGDSWRARPRLSARWGRETTRAEAVGTQHLLWIPGVNAIVVDEADRVLLQRRTEDGAWSVLSGILARGEEPAAGVVRE